ncbi:MAG: STAS domain-containing protein [Anaeromyxobacter sp.]
MADEQMDDQGKTSRVIRLDGTFDLPAARRVADAVIAARPEEQLEVDLTGVREFHDFGVAVLAQALAKGRGKVAVRGLRRHHVRLLRYLGIDSRADLGPLDESN